MDTQPKHSMDFYGLIAWAVENKKRLTTIGVGLLVVGAIVGIYFWHGNYQASASEEALDHLAIPTPEEAMRMDAGPYLEVANRYPDTTAAARALLIAGSIQYGSGKYDQAATTFQKYLSSHRDYPMVTQALVGAAASLEMQGKTNEAIARYEEVMRHSSDPNTIQAASALGRLYEAQGKSEQALNSLAKVVQETRQDSTWNAVARLQAQELLAKHPDLQQKLAQQQQQGAASMAPTAPSGQP